MASYKGKEINTTPSDAMASAAKRGLEWRKKYGRGGTAVGVARARDISNKKELSISTINRMASYFARHGSNKAEHYDKKESDGGPTAWRIAWQLWGGNPGEAFVRRVKKSMEAADERADDMELEERHVVNVTETEDSFVIELAKDEQRDEDYEAMKEHMEEERSADKVEYRAIHMEKGPIDEEMRTAMIAISSEEPVERSFGMEVLEHSEEAIDLSFLASGRAPLLLDHDPKQQIGVIESVELDSESRRLRAKVRFGRNGIAAGAFGDVLDGIKSNISVGYAITRMEKRGKDTYVAKSWRPVEASLVSIPADVTVGVGRSDELSTITVTENSKVIPMENVENAVDVAALQAEARKAEQKNAAQIVELGARHNQSEMAQKAIRDGKSIEEFRGELLESIGSEKALQAEDIGMTFVR
jgi:hypothetical protein